MTIIDLSRWQGKPDWARVRAAGVTTAIMRCCTGGTGVDSEYARNWRESALAGIPRRGTYAYVITGIPAAEQVANILRVTGGDFGTEPLTLDCERTKSERDAMAGGWVFPKNAYTSMVWDMLHALTPHAPNGLRIYTSANEWAAITSQPAWAVWYPLWVAHYNDHVAQPDCPRGWAWARWQYSCTGHVDGIDGAVDLNRERVVTPVPSPDPMAPAILAHVTAIRTVMEA
jgi:lysozyme